MQTRVVVIRIAGQQGLTEDIISTFKLLRLYRKNNCVIVPNNQKYLGMIKKVKDFVTWGELDSKTCKLLIEKRGKITGNISLSEEYMKKMLNISITDFVDKYMEGEKELKDIPGMKLFFRLHPPKGGYERKGTKKHYSMGGVLGYRKEKINDLINRMI